MLVGVAWVLHHLAVSSGVLLAARFTDLVRRTCGNQEYVPTTAERALVNS